MVLENFIVDAPIVWDRVGKKIFENPHVKQGRKMRVQITNAGMVEDLSGYTLALGWKHTVSGVDGLDVFEDSSEANVGIFEMAYTENLMTNLGNLKASLVLTSVEDMVVAESNDFYVKVDDSPFGADAEQGVGSYTRLAQILLNEEIRQEAYLRNEALVGSIDDKFDAFIQTNIVQEEVAEVFNNLEETYAQDLVSVKNGLEQTNAEFQQVIANVTIDSEVINARGGKTTLKERLDAEKAELSVQLAEIETELDQVPANGPVMKNLITNGDFSQGTTAWTGDWATLSVSNNVLSIVGTGENHIVQGFQPVNVVAGRKYYIYSKYRITSAICSDATHRTTYMSTDQHSRIYPQNGAWQEESRISTPTVSGKSYSIFKHSYSGWPSATDKVMEVKYVLMVDLTEAFGAGHEPTIQEMEAIMEFYPNKWFDGNAPITEFMIASAMNAGSPSTLFKGSGANMFTTYDADFWQIPSDRINPKMTLKDNFTVIKQGAHGYKGVGWRVVDVRDLSGQNRVYFANEGYSTVCSVKVGGTTIYNFTQVSDIWFPSSADTIEYFAVDYDKELLTLGSSVNGQRDISVPGLRALKNVEFTNLNIGINSHALACRGTFIIRGLFYNTGGNKTWLWANSTPQYPHFSRYVKTTQNLIESATPLWGYLENQGVKTDNSITFDYASLSTWSTATNSYCGHRYTYAISAHKISEQTEFVVKYRMNMDVTGGKVTFKTTTLTQWFHVRLINRDTNAVTDYWNSVTTFDVPIGNWTLELTCTTESVRNEFILTYLLGWGGCEVGAGLTVYTPELYAQNVVLSAFPQNATYKNGYCPFQDRTVKFNKCSLKFPQA